MALCNKVRLIIPTYNRHKHLKRSIDYWSESDLNVLILDSTIESYHGFFPDKIKYIHCPNLSFVEKISKYLDKIETSYSLLCADDDFITFRGIQKSIEFLEKNRDYGIAHGEYYSFYIHPNNKKNIIWKKGYISESIDQETPQERLSYNFSNYDCPTFYGVHRTKILKNIWSLVKNNVDDNRFSELLPSMLSVIYSKVKKMDGFYCARERLIDKDDVPDIFSFMKENTYDQKYNKFKNCLSLELSNYAKINKVESNKIIDKGMNQYLSNINKGKVKPIISLKKIVIYIIKKLHLFHIIKKIHKNSLLYKIVDPTLELKEFNIIKTLIIKYGNNF